MAPLPCRCVIFNGSRRGEHCLQSAKLLEFQCSDGIVSKQVCARHRIKCHEKIQDGKMTMEQLNNDMFTHPSKTKSSEKIEFMSIENSPNESPNESPSRQVEEKEKSVYVYYPKNSDYMRRDANGDLHINIKQLWAQRNSGPKKSSDSISGKSEVKQTKKPVAQKQVSRISRNEKHQDIEIIEDSDDEEEDFFGENGSVIDIDEYDGPTVIDSETGQLREMTDKEIDEMERLIQRYYRQFPQLQAELPPESRGHLDCNEWLKEIRIMVASWNSSAVIKDGFNATTSFVGHLCNCEPYFSQSVDPYKNESIEAQLKECELEMIPYLSEFTPSQRLMLSVSSALLMAIKHKHALENTHPEIKSADKFQ